MTRTVYLRRLGIDIVLITLCFFIAHHFFPSGSDYISKRTFVLYAYVLMFWYFASQATFLYNEFLSRSLSQEIVCVLKTCFVQNFFILIALFFASRNPQAAKWFISLYAGLQLLILPLGKYFTRWYFGHLFAKAEKAWNVLIIGAGKLGMEFYKITHGNVQLGYKVTGFLDDTHQPQLKEQYLGTTDKLEQLLHTTDVQEIVVALPATAINKINDIIRISEHQGKRIKIIPDYHKLSTNFAISTFGDLPIITIRRIPLDDAELRFFKSAFDVFFSIIAFICIFSWLFPLLAILIKLSSKGPVFYMQERWGINGKKIHCYKFRTMYNNVNNDIDDTGKFRPTEKNDSRVTPIGARLRKHNLDELPQFINVLKGEMSIAGPRPHASLQNKEMEALINNYNLRHYVKPGITGWAQIHGFRGETKELHQMQKRVEFDIWYIENWSLWLDFQIILQTVINMIKGEKNAY